MMEIGGAFAPFTNGWEWVDGKTLWYFLYSSYNIITIMIFPFS